MNEHINQRQIHARKRSRRLALQALYQWQLAPQPVTDIFHQFKENKESWKNLDEEYFKHLLYGVTEQCEKLDQAIVPCLLKLQCMQEVDPIERVLLRIAAYELQYKPDIPFRVIINEAIVLCKKFGSGQSHGFINAVLDQLARVIRATEISVNT